MQVFYVKITDRTSVIFSSTVLRYATVENHIAALNRVARVIAIKTTYEIASEEQYKAYRSKLPK